VRKLISEIPVNSEIKIEFIRDDTKKETTLITQKRGKFEGNEFECDLWGLAVKEITPRVVLNLKLKDDKGVLVTGVRAGGLAHDAEIFRGAVIRLIDEHPIENLEQFKSLYQSLQNLPEKGRMLELFYKNSTLFALLKEK
jgi:hypothetical protein